MSTHRSEIRAQREEHSALEAIGQLLEADDASKHRPKLSGLAGEVELPESLRRLLGDIVSRLLRGDSLVVSAIDDELTTGQAAELLNVSRQHVVDLLEAGEIPFHKAGTHRRILLRDTLAYRERRGTAQTAALDEIARLSFDEGMYLRGGGADRA